VSGGFFFALASRWRVKEYRRESLHNDESRWLLKERRGLHQCRAAWKSVAKGASR
jgi:hypothetical protein